MFGELKWLLLLPVMAPVITKNAWSEMAAPRCNEALSEKKMMSLRSLKSQDM